MTEITRVPLQPIAKGSLGKLWIGIAALALVGGGIAWKAMPPQVDVKVLTEGHGASPTPDDVAMINYKGTLPDGKVFDQKEHAVLPLAGVVPGFTKALMQMQRGGKYHVVIPSELAYGKDGRPGIPPNTDLTFDIELLDFISSQEFQQQMQMMQQLQQMQQQQGGRHGPPLPPGAPQGQDMPPLPEGAAPQPQEIPPQP